ncbi:DUF1648 domain-containing protein [Nocardioides sp. AE5]|uniref:DUF1648 domain-containing protein n=1 Tax=Nocardioides sp. AE5 TaxID=2962573 RepID=UPI00288274CE|nr:DUF1648 domain-containing protein [Nocardioides sp. AE5]MDT0200767.1 DUF1648 domain-containing protein [Nocardioides sp. AE5]
MARLVFWLSVLAYAGLWGVAAATLPERVPLHFGAIGEVDRWGSRTEALVTMGILGAAMALLFAALAHWTPRVPETLLNINARDKRWWLATPEREAELRRRLEVDLHVIAAATMVLLIAVEAVMIHTAHDAEPSLPWWFFLTFGAYLAFTIAWCAFLVLRRYRTPRDA